MVWCALRIPALLLFAAALAIGCQGNEHRLADVALSASDVPVGWVPADFNEDDALGLWAVLPELLTSDTEARLFIRAVQEETGLNGVATILIQADEPTALPQEIAGDQTLESLSVLLARQDALLSLPVLGGDPGAYFVASDTPLPGSVRSRLVRLLDEGYLFSDSVTFSVGSVLAVVTIWYPEEDEPFRQVGDLADEVERRLRVYLDEG